MQGVRADRLHDPVYVSARPQLQAYYQMRKAKARGQFPVLNGSIRCQDCSRPAQCWDHRDYAKPLEVAPVCWSCNTKRGHAK